MALLKKSEGNKLMLSSKIFNKVSISHKCIVEWVFLKRQSRVSSFINGMDEKRSCRTGHLPLGYTCKCKQKLLPLSQESEVCFRHQSTLCDGSMKKWPFVNKQPASERPCAGEGEAINQDGGSAPLTPATVTRQCAQKTLSRGLPLSAFAKLSSKEHS